MGVLHICIFPHGTDSYWVQWLFLLLTRSYSEFKLVSRCSYNQLKLLGSVLLLCVQTPSDIAKIQFLKLCLIKLNGQRNCMSLLFFTILFMDESKLDWFCCHETCSYIKLHVSLHLSTEIILISFTVRGAWIRAQLQIVLCARSRSLTGSQ